MTDTARRPATPTRYAVTDTASESRPTGVRYAIEMLIGAAWERLPEDGLYGSREEAERELVDHLASCVDALEAGFLADGPDADDFRVVEVVA